VRVQHSHCEAVGPSHWGAIERVLAREDAARAAGVDLAHDMFPYTGAATTMLSIYPPWALEGGVPRLLGRLADPSMRRAMAEAIEQVSPSWPPWSPGGWPHNLVRAVGWDRITIGSVGSDAGRRFEGMSLARLGRVRATTPFDAISDLMIEERGAVSQIIHGISGDEAHREGIDAILTHPAGAVCTDANDHGKGKPHPAACGAFARVLGESVRERGLLRLEEAIRKMTGLPASRLGLKGRGLLIPGAFADLVLFDRSTVGSAATFEHPRRLAEGIHRVFVNGEQVWDGNRGDLTGGPAGRVLRRE